MKIKEIQQIDKGTFRVISINFYKSILFFIYYSKYSDHQNLFESETYDSIDRHNFKYFDEFSKFDLERYLEILICAKENVKYEMKRLIEEKAPIRLIEVQKEILIPVDKQINSLIDFLNTYEIKLEEFKELLK